MSNKEKYINAFVESLSVDAGLVESLEYQSVPEWDSVGHMGLISAIEDSLTLCLIQMILLILILLKRELKF